MNKSELIQAVASETGLSKAASKRAIEAVIKSVSGALKKEEKVTLIGFGSFFVKKRNARKGVNPATQKTISIPAQKVVRFKVGSELAKAVM